MAHLYHHNPHDPTNQGIIGVPHGPETGDNHVHMEGPVPTDGEDVLKSMIFPHDSYNSEGVYWADLPLGKQLAFNASVDNAESRKELRAIWAMMKEDPLSPIGWYFRHAILPGAGLGLEGYVLFSIGNLTPLFSAVWPNCWSKYKTCNETWVAAVQYLEVCGIIVGQILVGALGDGIGRRWGLIQDVVIMFLGLCMLVASWGTTLNGWVICYAWSLFFYGIGVGGEYPMTATAAMENATGAGKISTREDRLHRGRKVTMAFLMQGWGQFFNQIILILLLLIFHHGQGSPPYSERVAQWTYRVSFAIPAVGTLWLVYYRTWKMPLASKVLNTAKKKAAVTGYDVQSLKLTFSVFGGRLIATAGAWYCNDIFFYGNKLFQGQFISVLNPGNKSVLTGWLWNMVNVGVSLCGYYLASFLIDNKFVGRKRMQQLGFFMDFILFVVPAFHYNFYALNKAHIPAFQAMYFLSSFFNQFGPNSTTFLVAAEVYPTPVRASAHGFSAAVGKLGALTAAVMYNYISTQQKFYVVPWFGLAGMLITALFLPDTTGLDLKEAERRFHYIRNGRESDYHGIAVHPHHLSLWERLRGAGKYYDPKLDYESKVQDLRDEWMEKLNSEEDLDIAGEEIPREVHEYFARTTGLKGEKKGGNARSWDAALRLSAWQRWNQSTSIS
ncbi:putative inorganic phosphate transporter C8E4.01c [Mollisia scopiformis]|uniref:Putative inorganic phosphate transporter C8E4.01c n=1 Tax=Mollisia scopiformis TaxID=149040 RepID=A0A194XEI2_MOLSC|nr:putative inorganic phosphate transporter C8E4.01c [Mollisia scopiformis]KUJ18583.1 putative inorganic phosphate transporter C8E4.01c [Mollisia scopiformis]